VQGTKYCNTIDRACTKYCRAYAPTPPLALLGTCVLPLYRKNAILPPLALRQAETNFDTLTNATIGIHRNVSALKR